MQRHFEEVSGMFDGDVVALTSRIDPSAISSLGPAEAAAVASAGAKRRNEFATGRRLAREGLSRLGVTNVEVPRGGDRAPVWPDGVAGSISHCNARAFAAVGERRKVGTLGIDAEDGPGLQPDLWSAILTGPELETLARMDPRVRERAALVIFSAKESVYKAQYAVTRIVMDFHDLRADLAPLAPEAPVDARFACAFLRDVGTFAAGTVVHGRLRVARSGEILTAAQIRE